MQSVKKSVPWLLAGAVLLALAGAATAQQPRTPAPAAAPASPQPAPNEVPQRTTAA